MLTGPRLPGPAEQVDGRTLRPPGFSDEARALLEHVWALMGMPGALRPEVVPKYHGCTSMRPRRGVVRTRPWAARLAFADHEQRWRSEAATVAAIVLERHAGVTLAV
jgi:hypothetical protein